MTSPRSKQNWRTGNLPRMENALHKVLRQVVQSLQITLKKQY